MADEIEEEDEFPEPPPQAGMYERVKDDCDPRRCQSVMPTKGQCKMIRIEGSKFCHTHARAGNHHLVKERVRNFRFTQFQARVNDFADSTEVKSLREEIGVLRIILEETINRCRDSTDLLMYSNKITDLVIKIDKTVNSCHKMEAQTGLLMDKQAALNAASIILGIIAEFITDEDDLAEASDRIIEAITEQTGKPKQE